MISVKSLGTYMKATSGGMQSNSGCSYSAPVFPSIVHMPALYRDHYRDREAVASTHKRQNTYQGTK